MNDHNWKERGPKGAIAAILAIMGVGLVAAAALAKQRSRAGREPRGYGEAGGFIDGTTQAELATSDFKMPEDMRAVIPEPPSYAPA